MTLSSYEFLRGMLHLRNTPDPDCKVSPAQIVFGRPLSDAFSFINRGIKFDNPAVHPMWREAWIAKEHALKTRFVKSVENLNSHAHPLPRLGVGDRVFVQNQVGSHPKKWDRSGDIVECKGNDQYAVKINGTGRLTLRNRKFLRRYTLPTTPAQTQSSGTMTMADGPYVHNTTVDVPGVVKPLPCSNTEKPRSVRELFRNIIIHKLLPIDLGSLIRRQNCL